MPAGLLAGFCWPAKRVQKRPQADGLRKVGRQGRLPLRDHGEHLRGMSVGTVIMASPGSTGNVVAALASFFIPGLGQLLQGKLIRALIMFVAAAILWWIWMGWIIHLWSIIDAALYKRPDAVR